MHFEYARRVRRHRRIDVDRDVRYFFRIDEQVQVKHQFLRAFDRKRGDDDFSAAANRFVDDAFEFVHSELFFGVLAIAVRAFDVDVVGRGHFRFGIADDRLVATPQIAGIQNARFIFACVSRMRRVDFSVQAFYRNACKRRTEDVPRVEKFELDVGRNVHFSIV